MRHATIKDGRFCIIGETTRKDGQYSYSLTFYPKNAKIESHLVELLGAGHGKLFFQVNSKSGHKPYLVDISFGCGCEFAGKKGIAAQKPCSHIKAVMGLLSDGV